MICLSVSNISSLKQTVLLASGHPETICLLSKGGRSAGNSEMSVLLGDDLSGSDQGEAEILVEILVGVISPNLRIADHGSLNDLDVARHSSMSSGHIVVHLTDGTSESDVPVLLVHIVSSASASVTEPDGEVLHLSGVLLEDLSDIENFTTSSLSLRQRLHVIPELRLSHNLVTSEDLHSIDLWARVLGGWSSTTNKLVEVHLKNDKQLRIGSTYVHAEGSSLVGSLDHLTRFIPTESKAKNK